MKANNMAPVVFNSSQVFREAEVLKSTITTKRKEDFSVGGELWSSCQSLQDLYKSILLSDLSYALEKKVEQELWNCAFKSHIDTMRQQMKDKKTNKKNELQALLMLFLESASGFYIQLLNELCLKYALEVPGYINPASIGILHDINSNRKMNKKPSASACYYICQDCLVHLGDLARYRNETGEAEVYYKQALQLVPTNGQPYNQLAILASSRGDTLGTVYFYCRSIAVKNQFPAASTNLNKTFSKACLSGNSSPPIEKIFKAEFMQMFIQFHGCIYLAQDLNVAKSLTENAIDEMKTLLESDDLPAGDLIKLVTINLFLLHHLTSLDDGDEYDSFGKDDHQDSWVVTLDFTMKMLQCLVERVTHQNEAKMKNTEDSSFSSLLPSIFIICQWFKANSPSIFQDEVVTAQPQIWIDFVNMLNDFAADCGPEKLDVVLPEDQELQGFLPLQSVHRKLELVSKQNSEKDELLERKRRLVDFGIYLSRHSNGIVSCQKRENGYYKFISAIDGSRGATTPFSETSSLFGNASDSSQRNSRIDPPSPIHDQVGQYSLFQSNWNVPLTVGNTVPNFVPTSPIATPASSGHPTKPTGTTDIKDSVPLVNSRAVGSHRSPTFPTSLPVPPTSLAVGSNRPLSPGNRVSPSPNGDKAFKPPSGFGLNIALGVWSPLGNITGNGHHDSGGGVKPQTNGTGNSIWGSSFHSAPSSMSPLEQLLKEQKSQQTS
ncbi:protein SMG7-like [Dendronephthya gigantea]|uniref:protein SMG7-like n=1 Tax=Dendronephthya gigantea TaxID=151771 RepID=UPI001069CB28|nr:protein SMG7-like [Dendronephthya gigantea]